MEITEIQNKISKTISPSSTSKEKGMAIFTFFRRYRNQQELPAVIKIFFPQSKDIEHLYKEIFDDVYPFFDNAILSEIFGKAESTLRVRATRRNLKKHNVSWSKTEDDYVLRHYKQVPVKEMVKELNRTKWAIINRYRELMSLR